MRARACGDGNESMPSRNGVRSWCSAANPSRISDSMPTSRTTSKSAADDATASSRHVLPMPASPRTTRTPLRPAARPLEEATDLGLFGLPADERDHAISTRTSQTRTIAPEVAHAPIVVAAGIRRQSSFVADYAVGDSNTAACGGCSGPRQRDPRRPRWDTSPRRTERRSSTRTGASAAPWCSATAGRSTPTCGTRSSCSWPRTASGRSPTTVAGTAARASRGTATRWTTTRTTSLP